jgi:hypothetical protein
VNAAEGCDLKRVMCVHSEMLADGVKPDTVTLNTILKAFERAGEWEQALIFFR